MLLRTYTKEIFRSKCMPSAESVHCFAHLDEDIREVIPYLNAELGGSSYTNDPPSVTFRVHGKLITVHPRKIAINALKDEEEAEKITSWLQGVINEIWDRRRDIAPSFQSVSKPVLLEVLKRLPKTNCGECGETTCMVFASRVVEGVKDEKSCPQLESENSQWLEGYLSGFSLD